MPFLWKPYIPLVQVLLSRSESINSRHSTGLICRFSSFISHKDSTIHSISDCTFKPHWQQTVSVLMVINSSSGRKERSVLYRAFRCCWSKASGSFINVIKSMTFPLSKASQQAQQLPKEVQSHFTSLHAYRIFTYPQHFSRVLFTTCTTLFLFAGSF